MNRWIRPAYRPLDVVTDREPPVRPRRSAPPHADYTPRLAACASQRSTPILPPRSRRPMPRLMADLPTAIQERPPARYDDRDEDTASWFAEDTLETAPERRPPRPMRLPWWAIAFPVCMLAGTFAMIGVLVVAL